jgi:hypothetical protein
MHWMVSVLHGQYVKSSLWNASENPSHIREPLCEDRGASYDLRRLRQA